MLLSFYAKVVGATAVVQSDALYLAVFDLATLIFECRRLRGSVSSERIKLRESQAGV